MNVQPSKHIIIINEHTHQGQWFEGKYHLSFNDPYVLAKCWRNYFNNQILDAAQNLWKDYHFIGSTNRISIFGPRPYANALVHLQIANHPNPRSLLTPRKIPKFESFLYCGLCNKYAIYHEHEYDDYPPMDPYDGYPFDAPSIN